MRRRVWMGKIRPSHTQRLMCILGRYSKPGQCLVIIVSSLRLPISDHAAEDGLCRTSAYSQMPLEPHVVSGCCPHHRPAAYPIARSCA